MIRKGEILNNIEKRTFIFRRRKRLFKLRNEDGELGKVNSHREYKGEESQRKERFGKASEHQTWQTCVMAGGLPNEKRT